MTEPIIDIQDVTYSYAGHPVLEEVNLSIEHKDFVAMIGPNGGGKTTLLKLILGLIRPDKGVVRVNGLSPIKASPGIGYVPQNVNINNNFPISAMDVVLMGSYDPKRRWARHSDASRKDAREALERMGMAEYADHKIGALSGGQRQRVFIARALVTRPSLLLLDEPTASIDTKGQTDFFKLLKDLNRDITVVVVSHDLLVISRYVKSVACINRRLHFHHQAEITGEMLETMYPCAVEEECPVELVAHGLPHRVLKEH